METKLTIVFGTYNDPRLIIPSIESLLYSNFENFLIYVVDDNFPDNIDIIKENQQILEKYNNDRIFFIKNDTNIGVPFVFEKWIDLVKTPYFMIFGAGDKLLPDTIQKMADFLDKNPSVSFVYGKEKFQENDGSFTEVSSSVKETGAYNPYKHLEYHLIGGKEKYGWSQVSAMYRKEFFKVKGISVKPYHYWDQWFHMEYLLFSNKIGFINEYMAIRHVEPTLAEWANSNMFTNKIETIYQSKKFMDEYETLLIAKRHPITIYRLFLIKNILRQIVKLKGIEELYLCSNMMISLLSKIIVGGILTLVLIPAKIIGTFLWKIKVRLH